MTLPSMWEVGGLPDFNGIRISATGSYTDGMIALWDQPRVYKIPGERLRSGPAVLVVRAIDTAYAGGCGTRSR